MLKWLTQKHRDCCPNIHSRSYAVKSEALEALSDHVSGASDIILASLPLACAIDSTSDVQASCPTSKPGLTASLPAQ